MRRALGLIAIAGLVAGCRAAAPPPAPTMLFDSRVSVAPLEAALEKGGGDPARIIHPTTAGDLTTLEPDTRYKFVVRGDGTLAIAPQPANAPDNAYAHPILADGGPVQTAGGLLVERIGQSLTKVVVDQDSQAYCPSAGSLVAAVRSLVAIGVDPSLVRVENRPPACVSAGASAPMMAGVPSGLRYGPLMVEVARRFEFVGKAFLARRFDLADFEVGEMGEIFEDDLPHAEPPPESQGVNLAGVIEAFTKTNLPDLTQAVASHDPKAFDAAFKRAAATCNGCHKVSGHPFIEVPEVPGRPVPRTDPK